MKPGDKVVIVKNSNGGHWGPGEEATFMGIDSRGLAVVKGVMREVSITQVYKMSDLKLVEEEKKMTIKSGDKVILKPRLAKYDGKEATVTAVGGLGIAVDLDENKHIWRNDEFIPIGDFKAGDKVKILNNNPKKFGNCPDVGVGDIGEYSSHTTVNFHDEAYIAHRIYFPKIYREYSFNLEDFEAYKLVTVEMTPEDHEVWKKFQAIRKK